MKILLIAPSTGYWRGLKHKRLFNGKTFRFSMLSLLSVAAVTPRQHQIKLLDEQVEEIPEDGHYDLVGITVMTSTAPRAYQLCKQFRERGIPVVLGGFHPTFNKEEATRYADALVIGPANEAWQQVLQDLEKGALKPLYFGHAQATHVAPWPRHLIQANHYLSAHTTYATVGCRNQCSFCSITAFYQGQRYQREPQEVVRELKEAPQKLIMFIDDNLTQDRDYALNLFEALIPLRKKWVTQASVEIADDPQLLSAMRKSGCLGVFIGLESFSQQALCSQQKTIRNPSYYQQAIKRIHHYGIFVEAGLVFGFDSDTVSVFEDTLRAVETIGIDAIQASILTPLPGTKLFADMQARIVDFNWEHYDFGRAVFMPANMSREDLNAGLNWLKKKYYSPWRIAKRLVRWLSMAGGLWHFYYPLALNVAYFGRQLRFNIKGYNPAQIDHSFPMARDVSASEA